MPEIIYSKKFTNDMNKIRSNKILVKKCAKAIALFEKNPSWIES